MSTQSEDTTRGCSVGGRFAVLHDRLTNLDWYSSLVDMDYLTTDQQLAIFMYICHSGCSFSDLSRTYSVTEPEIQEAFENTRDALLYLFDEFVKMPETPGGIKNPELLDDPKFEMFGTTMGQIVGVAAVCGIGSCSTQPGQTIWNPTTQYTGPQKLVFTMDVQGKFLSVYAPYFDNTMCDDTTIYKMARAEDCLPNFPKGKWLLAPTPNLMHSDLNLLGAFPDAEYPTNEEELESCMPRDGHGHFNLFHSRLYHALVVRPLKVSFWTRFNIFDLPDYRVSADLFKACVVVYNFFQRED